MTLRESLGTYADDLRAAYGTSLSGQPEDQLKAPVASFVRSVAEAIGLSAQTQTETRTDQGRPDLGVAVDNLLCGHIELKAPGLGANPERFRDRHSREQWEKFKALPNLIYTDGVDWGLYRSGERVANVVRLSGDPYAGGGAAVGSDDAAAFERLLREFLHWEPIVPHEPRRLAKFLAPLARLLREDVLASLENENSNLRLLMNEWQTYLFPEVDEAKFADAYAQTITYALLLGRLEGAPDGSPEEAQRVLGAQNGLLASVLGLLTNPAVRDDIGLGLGILERVLGAVTPHDLRATGGDLWLYFYEHFLSEYDPRLRRDSGVYYTPVEVVRCQVRLISQLLEIRFDKRFGFASEGVTVLDPAAGTGTYLVAAIRYTLERVRAEEGEGAVPGRASDLARALYGFEYLIGPYAVAHLRLTRELTGTDAGGSLPEDGLRLYLADTLETPHERPSGRLPTLTHRRWVEEQQRARRVKADTRVIVCVGNPPYDRQQAEEGEEVQRKGGWVRFGDQLAGAARQEEQGERAIMEDFLEPARISGAGLHLKNLYNDYVYFWRWALWKVFEQDQPGAPHQPGIVSFITAASYLAGPGFVGMREYMRRCFDDLWIINLEGDNHGARKSPNVFAIQTPVAIAIGVRGPNSDEEAPARVRYAKVEGSKEDKLAALDAIERFDDVIWSDCPNDWQAPFLPVGTGDFSAWPLLADLFPWQHSGVQFKRTWPIGNTQDLLDRRWHVLLAADANQRQQLFRETGSRKVAGLRLRTAPEENPVPATMRYGFRSLDRQFAFADDQFADRPRPQLRQVSGPQQVYMTTLMTHSLAEGPGAFVSALVPDLHHFRGSYGGADVLPLWRDSDAARANITTGILDAIGAEDGTPVSPEEFFAYCYGVLANLTYTRRFWEDLATSGPRVPITKDTRLFRTMGALGGRLVWLHTYGERMVPTGEQARVPSGRARAVAAIPATPEAYPEEFNYDPERRELRVGSGRFAPVAPEVYEYEVSGLKVVQSWLAYRMKSGAGRRSSPLDHIRPERWTAPMTRELLELLWVLEHTLAMEPELSEALDAIVTGPCFGADELPRPTDAERQAPRAETEELQERLI